MSENLRLGPLPKTESIRMTITLPSQVKADLDRYAQLYGAVYGEAVDVTTLVPHMLAAFMERDRAFKRARQQPGSGASADASSSSINAATSRMSATAGDSSTLE